MEYRKAKLFGGNYFSLNMYQKKHYIWTTVVHARIKNLPAVYNNLLQWYRAKEIKNLLTEYKIEGHEDWSTKFLLMFGRAHEFTPLATYNIFRTKNELIETNLDEECEIEINSTLTEFVPISKLMENTQSFNKSSECEDFEVDIENIVDGNIMNYRK